MSVDLRHGVLDPPLPVPEGERWPSVASLWERAKFLFRRVIAFVGSSERLARRERINRRDRRDLLDWLEPVEKIVRSTLIARAAIWLTKTAEGLKLMAEAKKIPFPDHAPPETPSGIAHPGWHTIASAPPEPEPPPARGAVAAETPKHAPIFTVLKWLPFDHGESEVDAPRGRPLPCSVSLLDATSPSAPQLEQHDRGPRRSVRLARRIDALQAVLDDPEPAFRRLVRFLASLPRGAINAMTGFTRTASTWHHADADVRASRGLACFSLEPFIDWEPG